MYPCVPNTTAVTQETDQKYGAFKSYFRSNLSDACADRLLYNKPLNFAPWIVGLFVFGGMDPETGVDRYRSNVFYKGEVPCSLGKGWGNTANSGMSQ